MSSLSPTEDPTVEERVAQLQEIASRRNALLREMYHLLERRENIGAILSTEVDEDAAVDDFLERFDLTKHPDTGSISLLAESEFEIPLPPLDDGDGPSSPSVRSETVEVEVVEVEVEATAVEAEAVEVEAVEVEAMEAEEAVEVEVMETEEAVEVEAMEAEEEEGLAANEEETAVPLESAAPAPEHDAPVSPIPPVSPGPDDDVAVEAASIPKALPAEDSPRASSEVPMEVVEELLSPEGQPASSMQTVEDAVYEDAAEELPEEIVLNAHVASPVSPPTPSPIDTNGSVASAPVLQANELLPAAVPSPVVAEEEEGEIPDVELRDTSAEPEPVAASSSPLTRPTDPVEIDIEESLLYPSEHLSPGSPAPVVNNPVSAPPAEQDMDMDMDVDEAVAVQSEPPAIQPTFVPRDIVALPPEAFMLPPRPSSQITISASLTPLREVPGFTFTASQEQYDPPPSAVAAVTQEYQIEFMLDRQYTLPPLKSLPAEFQRKGKLNKQRKRDKERAEKNSDKGDVRRDADSGWAPMGLNKWGVTMRTNPLWKRVSRATKTLNTREWGVAFSELRFIRTLERIEKLKDAGKWSYRQPKKQRGVGGLTKTHWDYLLDEMKWMRIDFREERKWKIALAYELSTAVLEWHEAGTRERRRQLGIVVCWTRPMPREIQPDPPIDAAVESESMEVDYPPDDSQQANLVEGYGSDESDDEQEQDKQDVVDALETNALLEEALDTTDRGGDSEQPQSQGDTDLRPKEEDVEDPSLLGGGDVSMVIEPASEAKPEDVTQPNSQEIDTAPAEPTPGLKSTSDDPMLGTSSQASLNPSGDPLPQVQSTKHSAAKSNAYAPLRAQIAYSDEHTFFLDFDELHLLQKLRASTIPDAPIEGPPPPVDLSAIFPDLQPFNFFDPNPAAAVASSSKGKKAEKRDRDDPHKRTEATTYNKLTPVASFMLKRPTLLGPLQPSEHWQEDHWTSFDDAPVVPDLDAPAKTAEDALCGAKISVYNPFEDDSLLPSTPRDPARRITDGMWTAQDDLFLKRLVERYPKNWTLIADTFNSARSAISTERRSDWECKERFKARWATRRNDQDGFPGEQSFGTPAPSRPQAPSQMTTRKRMASVSTPVSAHPDTPTSTPPVSTEPRKRRRHALLYDTIRKVVKKREAAQRANANPRKSTGIHDTHGQFNKMPKLSPAELSRMKAEKEGREHAEVLARRRAEEQNRAMALQHAQRMGGQVPAQPPAPQPAQNGAARPPANGLPVNQAVPQIRNISHQQRLPPGTASRMSPQQMMQVQAAQARVLAATNANMVAVGSTPAQHLSPPAYAQRAATSSPVVQASPPHQSATPNPPRPPSAQQQQAAFAQQSPNMVHAAAAARPNNMAHYYGMPGMHGQPQYTPEQMEQAIRLQHTMLAQRQNMQQAGAYPPQS
ncbi:hypothetical protein FA95DRAFT_47592 [Auriscalpium vulgare]|uniref:Uncharacterized protein n=1 Tax=Auriscalpium vulgare TaxID=40419 RepID=A0ACB8SCD4_9AGAM|nr:hypothetical protein FA95DRAFT_47592 [Auriscalpium vulgare]